MSFSVLCVHGVGHGDVDANLQPSWQDAIVRGVRTWSADATITVDFLGYDDLFDHAPLNAATYATAMAQLFASSVEHTVGDLFSRERALTAFPETLRWTAGMVAQWVTEDDLRKRARDRLLTQLGAHQYRALCAHSLGSLISYDALAHDPARAAGLTVVTLGSQIGNPAVRNVFAGRIEPVSPASHWYHLFNTNDHVFTADIPLRATNFTEVGTPFDLPRDPLNHNAVAYLSHANTVATVWRNVAGVTPRRFITAASRQFHAARKPPTRRALLVGINDYPEPANRLEGCVNDVFLVSAILQESGFKPEELRVVLNERATARAIKERLHWLLDDVAAGDQRVLFYSGHGAQIPSYGTDDEVDALDECLVPYDFDWSPQHAVLDDDFSELYSQLPYESNFVAVFDCCHSGGMTREGGRKVRGLSPPDDIRHRALVWNAALEMWQERSLPPLNSQMIGKSVRHDRREREAFLGTGGATKRLGRAVELRRLSAAKYDRVRKALGHHGPYLPIIMEACQEDQLSYEYRHGVTSYGAFTYSLAQVLRRERTAGRNPSFTRLVDLVGRQLKQLKYDQTPSLVGAGRVVGRPIPWVRPRPPRAPGRTRRR